MTTPAASLPESVSAAETNRNFSKLLREVREGRTYVVTSHGRPVAKISPYAGAPSSELVAAREAHLEELIKRPALNGDAWTREEIYER